MSGAAFSHPLKSLALLTQTDADAVRKLCDELPADTLSEVLPRLLSDVDRERFFKVVIPLLSDARTACKLSKLLGCLQINTILQVVERTSAGKLKIVLGAQEDALTLLMSAVEPDNGVAVLSLTTVLNEPDSLLQDTLVPLVNSVNHPERLGQLVSLVEADVLLWLLRGVGAQNLTAILNALSDEDIQPSGSAVVLLRELADNRGLVRDKVLPLLRQAEPQKTARLVQGVEASKLLKVIRSVDVDGLVILLDNTNPDLVVRLFAGSLDSAIAAVAGGAADVMRQPAVASIVKDTTDHLQEGLSKAEHVLQRGQQARGAGEGGGYQFGDFTRGLIASAEDDIKQIARFGKMLKASNSRPASSDNDDSLTVQDYARGVMAQGPIKEGLRSVQDRWDAMKQNLQPIIGSVTEGFEEQAKVLQDQISHGKEKVRALSCGSSTSAQRGVKEEIRF